MVNPAAAAVLIQPFGAGVTCFLTGKLVCRQEGTFYCYHLVQSDRLLPESLLDQRSLWIILILPPEVSELSEPLVFHPVSLPSPFLFIHIHR